MKREDLFLAIGEVDESRLARCENLSTSNVTALEEGNMEMNTKKRGGRPLRLLLVAAVMVCLIAAVALVSAAPEVQLDPYETPEAMLEAAFGINGYPGEEGKVYRPDDWAVNMLYIPSYERKELDLELAQALVVPYIYEVNETVIHDGDTLTVEAAVFDPVTGVGLLYYSIENPNGITGYELQSDGEIWWPEGERISVNYPEKSYIDTASTMDTKVFVVDHFVYNEGLWDDPNELIRQAETAGLQNMIPELLESIRGEALYITLRGADQRIEVPVDGMGGMEAVSFGGNAIWLSPVGMKLYGERMDMLTGRELLVSSLVIRYADGSEYVVEEPAPEADSPYTVNYAYALVAGEGTLAYALNRIVDVEQVVSVVVNGVEFFVD